jgi:hypothetical protein
MAIRSIWGLATLIGISGPALAGDCRLALVLALDVSGSVSAHEDRLQRLGLAHALLAPEVERAFLAGDPVALYIFEWSDEASQSSFLPDWQLIRSHEDLVRAAGLVARSRRTFFFDAGTGTAVGDALAHAAEALGAAPRCQARTVDVSGDGKSNDGIEPSLVYSSRALDGVTVNALVITTPEPKRTGWTNEEVVAWFEAEVLHGPGAFLVVANSYDDNERAMTAKLLRELALPAISGLPVAGSGA